jgi:biotin-(acetyl-CoA carboxylase) ligase
MHLPNPRIPPLFTGHAVKGAGPFDEACRRAARGEYDAGDFIWSRNTARASCALVLEPDVSLTRSCQMAALAAVAVGETLGHLCPPQVAVEFRWPGTILVNGGDAGSVRLALAATSGEDPPAWLALGIDLHLQSRDRQHEPGLSKDFTSLSEEGAADVTSTDVIEALATRLLAWLHTWGDDGFRPVHDQWLFRAAGRTDDFSIEGQTGRVAGLDEDGNLMLRNGDGRVTTYAYLPHAMIVG